MSTAQDADATRVEAWTPHPPEVVRRYRRLGLWMGVSLWDRLAQQVERTPNALAVVDRRQRLTYRELSERALSLARGLYALGIGPRDTVLVQLENGAPLIELYFALFRLGARPVATQPAHRRHELQQLARQASACAHFHGAKHGRFDLTELSAELLDTCPSLRHSVLIDDRSQTWQQLYRSSNLPLPVPPLSTEIALLQLSGGSTAVPKLIPRTHDDYEYSVRRSAQLCAFGPSTIYLSTLPLTHNFPLSSPGVLGTLFAGGRVVCAEHPQPQVTFPLIAAEQVSVTALVPGLLPLWFSAAARHRSQLTSLKRVQVGGAPLTPAMAARVRSELGCGLQQVFGMAEGLVCYTGLDEADERVAQYQGRPMSVFDEVRIVDDLDRDVPQGQQGHLLTRGPYTIRGYYRAPEHNAQAFTRDGFYRTGDRVVQLPDGGLRVVGRAKDQINRGGEKIAAPEVEALLCRHPLVDEAALVAVPDPFLGEKSVAFLVCRGEVGAADLRLLLRQLGVAEFKVPDQVETLVDLPRTPVGKVDKNALREQAKGAGAKL